MEEQTQKRGKNSFPFIVMLVVLAITFQPFGIGATIAAEKAVKHDIYESIGIVPDRLNSNVIYRNFGKKLIVVRFSIDSSSNWAGSYCVYTQGGSVKNMTYMNAGGYEYDVEECKAVFGI